VTTSSGGSGKDGGQHRLAILSRTVMVSSCAHLRARVERAGEPVPQQLARADNESGQAAVPVTVSVHGTMLNGALVAQRRYFSGKPAAMRPGPALAGPLASRPSPP
jgi:hypothetical protein